MSRGQVSSVLRHIRRLLGRPADGCLTDRQLLRRFAAEKDEPAFARLVERHGPMVLSVCRRILRQQQDAEDAFQATFLVLAQKAGSVAWRESVGGWLYEVAQRVAQGARRAAARRQAHERQAARECPVEQPPEEGRNELCAILDAELRRLPEKYRAPMVLCYLESYSHTEAAEHLGWAVGTVKGRLARARDMLQRRLAGRDFVLPAVALAAVLAEQSAGWAVPAALVDGTVKVAGLVAAGAAAAEAAPAPVAALANGLLRSLAVTRLKIGAALVLACSVVLAGAGLAAHRKWAANHPDAGQQDAAGLTPDAALPHGDALPPGAVARLGTPRFRHGGTLADIAFAPGGRVLATAGDDNKVRLWDPATGKELRCLAGHATAVQHVTFTADGKLLAAAGLDGTVLVWDAATGQKVGPPLRFHAGTTAFYAGDNLLAFHDRDNSVHFWDIFAGKEVGSWAAPRGQGRDCAALSPDGRLFALADTTSVRFWDIAAGKELAPLAGNRRAVEAIAFSPDGKTLAVVAGELALWDVRAGRLLHKLSGARPLSFVRFSPDGRSLASACAGGRTVLWDLTEAGPPRIVWESEAGGGPVAFSADGRLLAWGSDRTIRLLDATTRQELPSPPGHWEAVRMVAFSPDGKTILSAGWQVRVWDATTAQPIRVLPGRIEPGAEVALSRDGRTLAVGTPGRAVVSDMATGSVVRSFPAQDRYGLALSPDGRTLATCVAYGKPLVPGGGGLVPPREPFIRLWDVATGKELRRVGDGETDITSLAFSPDGTKLVAAASKAIGVWDVATGAQVSEIVAVEPSALSLSADGRLLAADDRSRTVRVWEVACGKELARLPRQPGRALATAFSPDGRGLITAADDDTLRIWDIASGKLLHEVGRQDDVLAVAFSPDGRRIASAGADTTVLIWDADYPGDGGRPTRLTSGELLALWADLAAADRPRPLADRAMRRLTAAPESAVPFLGQRLRQESEVEARLRWLIAGLDSDRREVQERCFFELHRLGKTAGPALRRALAGSPSPEARLRLEGLLKRLAEEGPRSRGLTPEELRVVRAAVVLARAGTPDAKDALRSLPAEHPLFSAAREADPAVHPLVNEARAALERLRARPGP